MTIIEDLSKLSESTFEKYLQKHGFEYRKKYKVENGRDFDFYVITEYVEVYCDVKIFTVSTDTNTSRETAKKRIRDDIGELRSKFGKLNPKHPCILISMNFSKQSVSGYTVVDAMYGDSGITIAKTRREEDAKPATFQSRGLHHVYKGNAKMREGHNTAISGILGFNASDENMSYLFHNQFAAISLPQNFFPDSEDIHVNRETITEDEVSHLTKISLIPY